jgi:exopolysaccharide biosynthesis polyprenyl glycosylphosphotransferase
MLDHQLSSVLGDRTLEILEQRREAPQVRRRGWLVRRMLLAADVLGLITAFLVSELVFPQVHNLDRVGSWTEVLIFAATLPGWVVIAKLYGLYQHDEERTDHSTTDDFVPVFHMVTVCTCGFWLGAHMTTIADPQVGKLLIFFLLSVALITVGRTVARALSRRHIAYLQNTIIVGAGEVGQRVARKFLNHPEYGINLVGFVDSEPKERSEGLEHLTVLGGPTGLPEFVRLLDVERVVIAFSNDPHEETLELIRSLKDLDVQVDIVPRFFELLGPGVGIHTVEGLPLFGLPPFQLSNSSTFLKRTVDLVLSLSAVVLAMPLCALIAALIKLDSRGPVFFRQVRMGTNDRTFRIWKFRTMLVDADSHKDEFAHLNMHRGNGGDSRMFKIPNDPRVTRVGRFFRRYSLDELPQLLNVLVGEMSLVGPRPLILDEDQFVTNWGRRRLDLKPGITGPWQVHGRSGIPFSEMVNLDYLYVTGWSLWGDLRLMFRTLPVVFRPANGESPAA